MADIARARPLLGTLVSVRVSGLDDARAHRAIDHAFDAVTQVQQRLSFHDPDSELSRINREAAHHPVKVSPLTWRVLALSLRLANLSNSAFNPCVAGRLVELGVLPAPCDDWPAPTASWQDVQLLPDCRVQLRQPVWLDVGGIAKGYAVDRALLRLRQTGASSAYVDAGGDLRFFGAGSQAIQLRSSLGAPCPVVTMAQGALASSAIDPDNASLSGRPLHGRTTLELLTGFSVSVVARQAWLADALTKVVLTDPSAAGKVLSRFGAHAYLQSPDGSWHCLPQP